MSSAALAAFMLSLATPEAVACARPSGGEVGTRAYIGSVHYFPPGAVESPFCDWFSEQLHSLEELPLTSNGAVFRLRFLELPAFDYPMSITVTYSASGPARIEARASNGLGWSTPGKLVYREQAQLSPNEIEFLIEEIARAELCEPSSEQSDQARRPGARTGVTADGTRNVFEWTSGDIYCLRHADARNDYALSKLAIWLVQRVYQFEVPPPPLRP